MKAAVRYLCISASLKTGLVFANELPENYFSPGVFIIEENKHGDLGMSYTFNAVQNSEEIRLSLTKYTSENESDNILLSVRSRTFMVQTKQYGQFNFRAYPVNWRYNKYVGKRKYLKKHNRLWVLKPLNIQKLEQVSIEHGFYFVGSDE